MPPSLPVFHELNARFDAPSVWLLCACSGGRRRPQGVTLIRRLLRRLERCGPSSGAATVVAEREFVAWVGHCPRCGRRHLATRRSALPFPPGPADALLGEVKEPPPVRPGPFDVEIDPAT